MLPLGDILQRRLTQSVGQCETGDDRVFGMPEIRRSERDRLFGERVKDLRLHRE